MKLFHQTTKIRYEKGIKVYGLIPGGRDLELNEDEMYEEELERLHAGGLYCKDSAEVVCLSGCPDGRYGIITLEIDSENLDRDAIIVFDEDAWTAGSERISLAEFEKEYKKHGPYADELGHYEIRYLKAIPKKHIKKIIW